MWSSRFPNLHSRWTRENLFLVLSNRNIHNSETLKAQIHIEWKLGQYYRTVNTVIYKFFKNHKKSKKNCYICNDSKNCLVESSKWVKVTTRWYLFKIYTGSVLYWLCAMMGKPECTSTIKFSLNRRIKDSSTIQLSLNRRIKDSQTSEASFKKDLISNRLRITFFR